MAAPTPPRKLPFAERALIALLAALVFTFSLRTGWSRFSPLVRDDTTSSIGTIDFLQYWSAHRLFAAGANPYDPARMLETERTVQPSLAAPVMMWNGPWLLPLIGPIVDRPFSAAASIWFALSILIVLAIGFVSTTLWRARDVYTLYQWSLLVSFFPIWMNLSLGQLGIVLALGALLLAVAQSGKRRWLTAPALLLLSIKPHIGYLVELVALHRMLKERQWSALGTLVLLFGAVFAITYITAPASFSQWLAALSVVSVGGSHQTVSEWIPSTLPGIARVLLAPITDSPLLPAVLIPGVCATSALVWSVRRGVIDWKETFPTLVTISAFTAAYGWIFDQSMVVFLALSLVARSAKLPHPAARIGFAVALLLPSLAAFYQLECCARMQHEFAWFPLPFLAIAGAMKAVERAGSKSEQGA